MNKIIFRSESERERAKEKNTDYVWYTLVDSAEQAEQLSNMNPWNKDDAVIRKKLYLLDDCVIVIRPARSEDKIETTKDFNKGYYFIEIMNQDASIKHSSRAIYLWEQAIEYSSWFKGLSFSAALRVWNVKKI